MNQSITMAIVPWLVVGGFCLTAPMVYASDFPPTTTVIAPATVVGERDGAPLYRKDILNKIHDVDKIYKSMKGPQTTDQIKLLEGKPELLWVIGYRAKIVSPNGREVLSDEFMCHSIVDFNESTYKDRFPTGLDLSANRLATSSQGQLEVDLPSGFGVPVMSDYPLVVNSQILNLNHDNTTLQVRQRVEIDFIRDSDLPEPLKPLFVTSFGGRKLISGPDGYWGLDADESDPAVHGPGCSFGEPANQIGYRSDGKGRVFTTHWILKPGREVNHTLVTGGLRLPYDTRAHVIATHMHPFAEYLELRDLTTGESVYKANISQRKDGIGLQRVTIYSSEEGIPLYRGHEYELVSSYNNTSGVDQDAMAGMSLYLHGRDIYDFMLRRR